jgi:hypothetical protein
LSSERKSKTTDSNTLYPFVPQRSLCTKPKHPCRERGREQPPKPNTIIENGQETTPTPPPRAGEYVWVGVLKPRPCVGGAVWCDLIGTGCSQCKVRCVTVDSGGVYCALIGTDCSQKKQPFYRCRKQITSWQDRHTACTSQEFAPICCAFVRVRDVVLCVECGVVERRACGVVFQQTRKEAHTSTRTKSPSSQRRQRTKVSPSLVAKLRRNNTLKLS